MKWYLINLREHKQWTRAHFIPDLKIGVFVTLRTPNVINRIRKNFLKNLNVFVMENEIFG